MRAFPEGNIVFDGRPAVVAAVLYLRPGLGERVFIRAVVRFLDELMPARIEITPGRFWLAYVRAGQEVA